MVIKKLLDKAGTPPEQSDAKVKALREKLQKLQQGTQQKAGQPQQPTKQPAAQPSAQAPKESPQQPAPAQRGLSDTDIEKLASASAEERKAYAQQQDPQHKIREERTHKLVAKQVAELIELTTEQEKRLKKLEQQRQAAKRDLESMQQKNDETLKKMRVIDQRLEKFMGLYEVITNQYNPFAEKNGKSAVSEMPPVPAQEAVPAEPSVEQPAQRVNVEDNLTGSQADVDIQPGMLSSENQQKIQQLLQELQADEYEKEHLDSPDEIEAVEVREDEREKMLVGELHTMLAGFEDRMKQYLDATVQEKLHESFEKLEGALDTEVEQAVKEDVAELRQNEDIIESALQELEELQSTDHGEEFAKTRSEVEEHVRHVDEQIKAIPPSLYFQLADGRVLKSKTDLILALQTMPDAVFSHHVSDSHNHFADWLELALNDPQGGDLRGHSREEMLRILQSAKL